MAVFTISELHLSLSSNKSMEIFEGWENYVQKLKKNWTETVTSQDTVVIIGDVSWAMKIEESYEDLKFIDELPGKKIIIKGNHDFWWNTLSKVKDFIEKNNFKTISVLYNTATEVDGICICGTRGWMCRSETDQDKKVLSREAGRLRRSLEIAESKKLTPIVFLHYPPIYRNIESEDIINLLIEKKVKKCYYGHIHGNGAIKKIFEGEYKGIDLKLVSCDYINFCPLLVK